MNTDERRKLLAVIHMGKKEAGLPDADYRAVLLAVAGTESAADCDMERLKRLAEHFKIYLRSPSGREHGPGGAIKFYRIIEGTADWRQKRKIAALWAELGYGLAGLDVRARKQFGAADFLSLSSDDLQILGRDLARRLSRRAERSGQGFA